MYIPKPFEITDITEVASFLKEVRFGAIISCQDHQPVITHLPFLVKSEAPLVLHSHIAIANKHHSILADNTDVVIVFSGVHGYVSSSVYEKVNAPTYNYEVVHLHAKLNYLEGNDIRENLKNFVHYFEKDRKKKMAFDAFPEAMLSDYLKEIALFDLTVYKIEASFKMSQNRNEKDLEAIIADAKLNNEEQLSVKIELRNKG